MQIATFFVPLAGDPRSIEVLNAFLRSHRVLKVDKAFADGGWCFCVEWIEGENTTGDWKRKVRVDWKEKLAPEVFERFAKLRERRKKIAAEDGVPPYMVMTDAQMAEAAKPAALTPEVLRRIEGFGEMKMKKYGERLLVDVS